MYATRNLNWGGATLPTEPEQPAIPMEA